MSRPDKKASSKGGAGVRQAIRRALGKSGEGESRPKEWRTYAAPFFMMPLRWRTAAPAQAAGHHAVPEEDAPPAAAESKDKRRPS